MLGEMRKLIGCFNNSSQLTDSLRTQQEEENGEVLELIQDVPTRMGSTCSALRRLMELKEPIHELVKQGVLPEGKNLTKKVNRKDCGLVVFWCSFGSIGFEGGAVLRSSMLLPFTVFFVPGMAVRGGRGNGAGAVRSSAEAHRGRQIPHQRHPFGRCYGFAPQPVIVNWQDGAE